MADIEQKSADLTLDQIDKLENRHKICACCNKEFYLPLMVDLSQYAYKVCNPMVHGKKSLKNFSSQLWFCSWSCFRKFEKSNMPKLYKRTDNDG